VKTRSFSILGVLLAFFCIVAWAVVPTGKFIHFLASSPRLDRTRLRAVWTTIALAGIPLTFLSLIPFPHGFKAPGVVEARTYQVVVPGTAGKVVRVDTPSNTEVDQDTPLVQLENPDIAIELERLQARLREALFRRKQALEEDSVSLEAVDSLIESVLEELEQLRRQRESLFVMAPQAGLWVSPELEQSRGRWVERGEPLGLVLDSTGYRFSAVISQNDAARLFTGEVLSAEIRMKGRAGVTLSLEDMMMIPMERSELPSPALGFGAGGEIETERTPSGGVEAAETFFEVRGEVMAAGGRAGLRHGRSGRLRMELPPEPLMHQWVRRFRQLFQKYYL